MPSERLQPPGPGQQGAGGVAGRARFAQRGPALGARFAVPAGGHEDEHDVVTDGEVVAGVRADLLHDAGGLVAQRHRQRPGPVAVDHREVRVAQAGGLDPDQDLPGPGRIELELFDDKGFGLRVGGTGPGGFEYRRVDGVHAMTSAWLGTLLASSSTRTRTFSE